MGEAAAGAVVATTPTVGVVAAEAEPPAELQALRITVIKTQAIGTITR